MPAHSAAHSFVVPGNRYVYVRRKNLRPWSVPWGPGRQTTMPNPRHGWRATVARYEGWPSDWHPGFLFSVISLLFRRPRIYVVSLLLSSPLWIQRWGGSSAERPCRLPGPPPARTHLPAGRRSTWSG